jgi:hypothetical protein
MADFRNPAVLPTLEISGPLVIIGFLRPATIICKFMENR